MNTAKTLSAALLALAGAVACMAAEEGYGKYSRQRELARQGEQLENRGKYKAAAKAYGKSRLYAVDNRTRAGLLLREAECHVQRADPYDAFDAYTSLLESFPLHTPYDRVIPRLRQLAGDFERGRGSWLGIRNRSKAIEVYELVLQETPVGSGIIQDSLTLGGLLTATKRPAEAIVVYREALKRFPGDPLAPQLRLELGRLLTDECRTGDGDGQVARQAVRELRTFVQNSPDDPARPDAEFLLALVDQRRADALVSLAQFYLRPAHRREPAARRYLSDAIRDYPGTTAADEAGVLLASLGPAPVVPEMQPEPGPAPAPAIAGTPAATAPVAQPAKEKGPDRRLLEGLLPGGTVDEGPPREMRSLQDRDRVGKWLLPLGDLNELKAGGGSQP
jgi:tetratricopeptide (TPR) repeat protein